MVDLVFLNNKAVNLRKLREELAVVLGDKLIGTSAGHGKITVHVADDAALAAQQSVAAVVAGHDASKLTSGQQAAADREAEKALLNKPWATWTEADKDDLLRILAEEMGLITEAVS